MTYFQVGLEREVSLYKEMNEQLSESLSPKPKSGRKIKHGEKRKKKKQTNKKTSK